MGAAQKRLEARRKARQRLANIFELRDHVLVIHYSCESFYNRPDGSSARITSIAVRNLGSAQTKSFSIHQMAEIEGIQIEQNYDQLEKKMLKRFYEYAKQHSTDLWLHWNMRDINYGFEAVAHRYRVLGGEPFEISEEKRIDLARLLIEIYGVRYVSHPRLENIVRMNAISNKDFLTGAEEARAFEDGEYVKLHQSTLRKVDIICNLAHRANDGSLKTAITTKDRLRDYPDAVAELLREHWIPVLITFLISIGGLLLAIF